MSLLSRESLDRCIVITIDREYNCLHWKPIYSHISQMKAADPASEMSVYVRVVERGSFSDVARELGLTPSAVSKIVSRLEDRLEARLLHRTTRNLMPTPEGQAYYERCQHILLEIEEAESEVMRFRERPRGRLRMSVGVAFGLHALTPALPRFLERYPEVKVELLITDRHVDLAEEGADLGIRIGNMTEASFVARKICDLQRVICASPDYLARNGIPDSPDALASHNCLALHGMPELQRWPFDEKGGRRVVGVSGSVAADNADALLQLAIAGVGIIRLTDLLVGPAIKRGALVPVLTHCHHVEPVPMYVYYPYERNRAARVAAMADFIVESFAGTPWRVVPESGRKTAS